MNNTNSRLLLCLALCVRAVYATEDDQGGQAARIADDCLRQKASAIFGVEFSRADRRATSAKLENKMGLGRRIEDLRQEMQAIVEARHDCGLTKGATILHDGKLAFTFWIICEQPAKDTVFILNVDFIFSHVDGPANVGEAQLMAMDYSTTIMSRKEFTKAPEKGSG